MRAVLCAFNFQFQFQSKMAFCKFELANLQGGQTDRRSHKRRLALIIFHILTVIIKIYLKCFEFFFVLRFADADHVEFKFVAFNGWASRIKSPTVSWLVVSPCEKLVSECVRECVWPSVSSRKSGPGSL